MSSPGLSGLSVCSSLENGSWAELSLASPRQSRVGDTDLPLFATVVDFCFAVNSSTEVAGEHNEEIAIQVIKLQ